MLQLDEQQPVEQSASLPRVINFCCRAAPSRLPELSPASRRATLLTEPRHRRAPRGPTIRRLPRVEGDSSSCLLTYSSISRLHSNTSASFTAFFRSCSEPKYRSVVKIDSWPSRN